MYRVRDTVYRVRDTVYRVRDTVYRVRDTVYRVRDTVYRVRDTVYRVRDTVYRVRDTVYRVRDTVYRVRDTVYRVRDTVYRVRDTVYRVRDTVYRVRDTVYRVRDTTCKQHYYPLSKQHHALVPSISGHLPLLGQGKGGGGYVSRVSTHTGSLALLRLAARPPVDPDPCIRPRTMGENPPRWWGYAPSVPARPWRILLASSADPCVRLSALSAHPKSARAAGGLAPDGGPSWPVVVQNLPCCHSHPRARARTHAHKPTHAHRGPLSAGGCHKAHGRANCPLGYRATLQAATEGCSECGCSASWARRD